MNQPYSSSSPEEDPEFITFRRSAEKLHSSLEPRREAFTRLLEALPDPAVTKSETPRLFKQEARKSITWLSMLQNTWPRYAFALIAVLTVVGITFGLNNQNPNTAPNPVIGSAPKETSPAQSVGTPVIDSDGPVSAGTPIDTVLAELTTVSDEDFGEEDRFESGSDAEEDALLISLYESYDEDTL